MIKRDKQIIIDAIIKHLEQGRATEKICAVICSKFQFTERTFYNHFKIAQIEHTERQQAIKTKLAIVDEQAAIDARKKAIMTAEERKELLTLIAKGQIKIKKPFVIAGKIMEYPAEPDHSDRMKAMAELSKMDGDYSPVKSVITGDLSLTWVETKTYETDQEANPGA